MTNSISSTGVTLIRHVTHDPASELEVRRRRIAAQDAGRYYFEHLDRIGGPSYEADQADGLVTYALSSNKRAAGVTPIPLWLSFEEFVDMWREPLVIKSKDDGPLFSAALFHGEELYRTQDGVGTGRCRRAAMNLRRVTIIGFDYDEGDVDLQATCQRLRGLGLQAFVYTTFSHTPEKPKLRILIPLRRPIEVVDQEQRARWRLGYEAVADMIGAGIADPSCKDPNRLFYPPMHKAGAPFHCEHIDGLPLDFDSIEVSELVEPAPPAGGKAIVVGGDSPVVRPPRAYAGRTHASMSEVVAALQCIPACCSRKEWLTILFALHSEWSDDAFEMFEAWSQTCPEKFDEQDLTASWDGADPDG
jgi:hypothetical protein